MAGSAGNYGLTDQNGNERELCSCQECLCKHGPRCYLSFYRLTGDDPDTVPEVPFLNLGLEKCEQR